MAEKRDWRETYDSMVKAVASVFGGATASVQQPIFEGLRTAFENKIKEGKVTPGLGKATIQEKERLARKNKIESKAVKAPLFRTGKMAESLMIMEQTATSLVIGSDNSPVSPQWHSSEDHRADNVPQRVVLDDDEVLGVIDSVMGDFLANLTLAGE